MNWLLEQSLHGYFLSTNKATMHRGFPPVTLNGLSIELAQQLHRLVLTHLFPGSASNIVHHNSRIGQWHHVPAWTTFHGVALRPLCKLLLQIHRKQGIILDTS